MMKRTFDESVIGNGGEPNSINVAAKKLCYLPSDVSSSLPEGSLCFKCSAIHLDTAFRLTSTEEGITGNPISGIR